MDLDMLHMETINKKNINNLDLSESFQLQPTSFLVNSVVSNVSARIWHERVSHLSFKCLDTLKSQLHCKNFKYPDDAPCYICPLAKQRRLSFTSHNNMSQHPFDLIHCDICGLYHINTISGYRYFLTLVDDCTRFTCVFLLRDKSNVTFILPRFLSLIQNQFNSRVKQFRYDNANELAFIALFS